MDSDLFINLFTEFRLLALCPQLQIQALAAQKQTIVNPIYTKQAGNETGEGCALHWDWGLEIGCTAQQMLSFQKGGKNRLKVNPPLQKKKNIEISHTLKL